MSNWKKISDFITFSIKGITPTYVENSSIIVLNQKCIRNGVIDYSLSQFADDTKQISELKFVKKGDILINSTGVGTAGRCAFVDELPVNKKLLTDSHILLLRCNSYFEARCLSYLLFSFEKTLMSFMTGSSGQGELDKVMVLNLLTKLPENSITQKKIAKVLSDLDAKIELNNRINTELEAMAKMLYDYWFVQFDFPDANGKPYKTSGGKMVWNEELKREIPEGWEVGTLDSIGDIIGGSTPSKAIDENFCIGEGTPWITPKDLSNNKGKKYITRGEYDVTERGLKEASLKILPEGTVLLSSRAPIGYLAIARTDVTTNQGFKSFVPKNNFSSEYIYFTIQNSIPEIEANSSGSTFKEVSSSTLKTIKTILPIDEILLAFDTLIKPIFNKQDCVELENQELASLRDWLLPMLMNGQVSVGDDAILRQAQDDMLGMVAEPAEIYKK